MTAGTRDGLQTRMVARGRWRRVAPVIVLIGLSAIAVATIGLSLALFTARSEQEAAFETKAIFPGERVTPAFVVTDASSGTPIDRTSPFAVSSDGLTVQTSAWSSGFASDRYLEFDFNGSLASGLAVTGATFDLRIADDGAGTACYYIEVRRISTGAVLGTSGSPTSPAACTSGPSLATFSTSMPAVATTGIADDLRVRVFGRQSASGATVIDLAAVGGSTAYQAFTLYPTVYRDAADGTEDTVPWGLQAP